MRSPHSPITHPAAPVTLSAIPLRPSPGGPMHAGDGHRCVPFFRAPVGLQAAATSAVGSDMGEPLVVKTSDER